MHKPRTDFAKKAVVQPVCEKAKLGVEHVIKISPIPSPAQLGNTIDKVLSTTPKHLIENNILIKLANKTNNINNKDLLNKPCISDIISEKKTSINSTNTTTAKTTDTNATV